MATCRSCGAAIRWVLTEAGKRMPIDPEPVLGGNVQMTRERTREGVPLVGYTKPDPAVARHVSHFATCPSAKKHRKRG